MLVLDPVSALEGIATFNEVSAMMMRLIDQLKSRQVTALFTSLNHGQDTVDATGVAVSSLIDSWILVRQLEDRGERIRGVNVIKSRGMAHSNQIRELVLSDDGIGLQDVYVGPDGVMTGSARSDQELKDREVAAAAEQAVSAHRAQLELRRKAFQARIAALQAEFEAHTQEIEITIERDAIQQQATIARRTSLAQERESKGETGTGKARS